MTPLQVAVPALIVLLFVALPAWLGAGSGHAVAVAFGEDVRKGAASGAFRATFMGVVVGTVVLLVLLYTALSQARPGSGIMTPAAGGVLMTLVILPIAGTVALLDALLAALGAWLGATSSRGSAGLLAALCAASGAVGGLYLMTHR